MAQGTPIFILPEGALRTTGRDAQKNNIMAAKAVADAVRSTLGPRGMDKMLVDDLGDIVITNDGATIVEEMNVEHPAAKMVIEVAKTQDDEVGDGTTTAVVLTGELLAKAESLIEVGIHPTIISRGYRMAAGKALETLNSTSKKISLKDSKVLEEIAITAMTGKGAESSKNLLAKLSVKAIQQIAEEENGKVKVDLDNIQVEKKQGGVTTESELIQGLIIDKERVHTGMPKMVDGAKIALLDAAIEIKDTETDAEISITSPEQLQAFVQQEENMLKEMVENVANAGANVLFCQKGIDDLAQHFLNKAGIFAVRRVKKSDMDKLAKATGARIVTSIKEIEKQDLGQAKVVEEVKISGDEMVFIRGCKNPKAVSVLIRGGTEHVIDEVERAINDALGGIAAAVEVGYVVAGGGAPEMHVAQTLRKYADTVGGREQLAVNAFADAMEIIPRTLADSAGMDAIDTLVKLRAKHEAKAGLDYGVYVDKGKIDNLWSRGVIEPLKIKTQAIQSASEAAELILRIDDVISTKSAGGAGMPPGGMPPGGMGGMEGMM